MDTERIHKRAFIIGCSKYRCEEYKEKPLPNSLQDVFEFEKILKSKWGFSDEEIRFRKLCNSFHKENQVIT
jgi:hypothetical protein